MSSTQRSACGKILISLLVALVSNTATRSYVITANRRSWKWLDCSATNHCTKGGPTSLAALQARCLRQPACTSYSCEAIDESPAECARYMLAQTSHAPDAAVGWTLWTLQTSDDTSAPVSASTLGRRPVATPVDPTGAPGGSHLPGAEPNPVVSSQTSNSGVAKSSIESADALYRLCCSTACCCFCRTSINIGLMHAVSQSPSAGSRQP